tara:strand:- start:193 stop:1059 length:867 start_codon:yes stop_codon:yes gene_type:complete
MSSSNICNNCNAKLYGEYCSECGQQNKELNISIFSLIKEFLVNIFSLDSKIFHTLRLLLIKPGYLSNEYIIGRQKKYVLPGKLYLFLSVLTILIVSLIRDSDGSNYMKFSYDRLGILISNDIDGSTVNRWGGYGGSLIWDSIDSPIIKIDQLSLYSKSFLLCFPIYALLLKLFYRKKMYIHNMILSLHNHIFILIIVLISIPISQFTGYHLFGDPTNSEAQSIDKIITFITFSSLSLYIYLSALNFYKETKLITLIKFIPLVMGWFLVLAYSFVFVAYLFISLPRIFY